MEIQDYTKKMIDNKKRFNKILIFTTLIAMIFAFSSGFYFSYKYYLNKQEENAQLNKFNDVYNTILSEWYYGIDDDNLDEKLIANAISGILDNDGDIFTRYVTSIDYLNTSSIGIGISVMKYGEYFYISDVINASLYGRVQVGDILKEIDGNSLSYKETSYISSLILNKASVSLLINRNGTDILVENVSISAYNTQTVFLQKDIATDTSYVRISEFSENTASDLETYLEEIDSSNLILDLRDNPGGYITSVVAVADLFMGSNKLVIETRDKAGNSLKYNTSSADYYDFNKIVVLINENSASGAEALSAALNEQLDDKVILFGETTYGKGSAQKTLSLGDTTYLVYTYALWFTPLGNSINHIGVDAEVDYDYSGLYFQNYTTNALQEDDLGDEVKYLQDSLNELGYHVGEWDYYGYFESDTIAALSAFQSDNGLVVTGEYDEETIRWFLKYAKDSQVISYEDQVDYVINNINIIGE